MKPFAFERLDGAINALAQPLAAVGVESDCQHLLGRVLAREVVSDRDNPPADISAMDGYAVAKPNPGCPSELDRDDEIPVTGQSAAGGPPPDFVPGGVVRIFTGAMIPANCDRVIQREHTAETPGCDAPPYGTIHWREAAGNTSAGENIRRRGENLAAGAQALPRGIVIGAPQLATMASFGIDVAQVHRLVRVAIITTGDELGDQGRGENQTLPPWMIRNSNAPALHSILASRSYVQSPTMLHAPDDPHRLRELLSRAVAEHDIVLLTGGVSMGDHDYVPQIVSEIGAKTIFHKLPLRPGKPILGAIAHCESTNTATAILGLPGNPVSATMGAVRFALPLMEKLAGITRWQPTPPAVTLNEVGEKTLPLHWLRAVRLSSAGRANLVIGKGSGDLVSLAASDGFIEMPPEANNPGPWPFYAW